MLEEIEVPPRLLGGVVHGATVGVAVWAGEARAGFEVDADIEALLAAVEDGRCHEPGRGDAEGKLEEVVVAHVGARAGVRSWRPVCRRAGRPSRPSPRGRPKWPALTAARHVGLRSAIRIKLPSDRSSTHSG